MSYQTAKLILWAASGIFCLSGLAIVFILVNANGFSELSPDSRQYQPSQSVAVLPRSEKTLTAQEFRQQDFIDIWKIALRRPFLDPAVETPKPVSVVAQTRKVIPEITLAGTMIEAAVEERRAWLVLPGGIRKLVYVGQVVNEVAGAPTIEQIEDGRVVIKMGEVLLTKELPPPASVRFGSL